MASNAVQKRHDAINTLVAHWIETEDPLCMGDLIQDGNFAKFAEEIRTLNSLGRTDRWHNSLLQWENLINDAERMFRETEMQLDNPDENMTLTWEYANCSYELKKEYARLLKWAIWQGAIFAGYGAL